MYLQKVASFILVKGDLFLVEKRKESKKVMPGAIVTPVGKFEEGETSQEAMLREVNEELSIIPKVYKEVCVLKNKYSDHISKIYYFVIDSWDGEINYNEAEKLHWIKFNELNKLTLEVDRIAINEVLRTREYPF